MNKFAIQVAAISLALWWSLPAGAAQPGTSFRDCRDCPEMIVVPAGSFAMGAPDDEADRQGWDGPQVKVTIARPFALGKYEVTRGEFARCVAATHHKVAASCRVFDGKWDWYDALAYVEWLNIRGRHRYYLPLEAEFEYANRAGSRGRDDASGMRVAVIGFRVAASVE